MKYIDDSFAAAIALFSVGAIAGAFLVLILSPLQGIIITLLQARVVAPMRAARQLGNSAILLLVFVNNSIPISLSYAYPYIIAKLNWIPPLTPRRRRLLLSSFTFLCAFLLGFFGIGTTLSIAWLLGGRKLLFRLVSGASVHGPIEIGAILLCVSEPLRLAEQESDLKSSLGQDLKLLILCLLLLCLSATIEVFVGL